MENNKHYDMIVPDDNIRHNIVTSVITKMTDFQCALLHETAHLIVNMNVLDAKYDVEQLLTNECENFHRLACNDGNEDEPHKVMKELIMIIVNRYGGAISANTLQHLLGKCKEFGWAVVSLMTSERLSAVSHTDGSPACFFIPSVCDKKR